MWACGSASRQARSTPPSPSKAKTTSGLSTRSAPRAKRRSRSSARAARRGAAPRSAPARPARGRRGSPRALAVGQPRVGCGSPSGRRSARRRSSGNSTVTQSRSTFGRSEQSSSDELGRQHRRDEARHVDRERALGGAAVERRARARRTTRRPRCARRRGPSLERSSASSKSFAVSGSIVNVEPVAQVDAALRVDRRRLVRLEPAQLALLDEQPLEHGLDRARRPEHALDLRAAAARCARRRGRPGCRRALPVEQQRACRATKYGSPTRCFPGAGPRRLRRRWRSTDAQRASDLEETADRRVQSRRRRARGPSPRHDQDVELERPGVDVGCVRQMDQRHEQRPPEHEQDHRRRPPRPGRRAGLRS